MNWIQSYSDDKVSANEVDQPHDGEYLIFRLGGDEYGVGILYVQEIRSYVEPTHIANAPAFVKGVTNLRGVIIPIIDLRDYFELEHVKHDAFTVIVFLNISGQIIGVVVDRVNDVVRLTPEHIKNMPSFKAAIDTAYIDSIGSIDDRMLLLLNFEKMMAGVILSNSSP